MFDGFVTAYDWIMLGIVGPPALVGYGLVIQNVFKFVKGEVEYRRNSRIRKKLDAELARRSPDRDAIIAVRGRAERKDG